MCNKKPVYNGYEERYVNGKELKNQFENCYYTAGKHHSVVLGITIPDYLELSNLDDTKTYRIFINKNFCRIMDGDNDHLVTFFGYYLDESINSESNNLQKKCQQCGAAMRFKEGRFGEFLGCSRYPKCRNTVKLPIIGHV